TEDPTPVVRPLLDENRNIAKRTPDPQRWPSTTALRSPDALRGDGRKVLIIEPVPIAPMKHDPRTCLSKAQVLEDCRYAARATPDPLERLYRRLDHRHDDVWAADFDRLVCPFLPICDPRVNNPTVKFDPTHLTDKLALS